MCIRDRNKEINVNKKAMNKKMEEENIMVNRQIREIDGKCNQTEKEVQEVKEVVNIKFTNIEEHSRRKVEEQRKETQEEFGRVRNQVAEQCNDMQETMTNITGQVRQSREEMEAIRNRPTHFTGLPINESRE